MASKRWIIAGSAAAVIAGAAVVYGVQLSARDEPPPPPGATAPPDATAPPEGTASPPEEPESPGATAPAPSADSVHFTAAGDYGLDEGFEDVLRLIADAEPDLHLALGDLSYEDGTEERWCGMVTDALGEDFPFQLIAGNHESNGEDGDIENFADCLPNRLPGLSGDYGEQWYADVPEDDPLVRFVMISPGIDFGNGNRDYSEGSDRYDWTAEAIDDARDEGIPWVVAGMHTPCLSIGRYDCEAGAELTNMLLDKKVDLVLHGHEHLYQRTHQLATGFGCSEVVPDRLARGCIADTDSALEKGAGTVFATNGLGGRPPRGISRNDAEAGYFASWSGQNSNPTHGILDITVTADRLEARFVPVRPRAFTDSFTISEP